MKSQVFVIHIGTVRIYKNITLTIVLCALSFSFNLVSVTQVTTYCIHDLCSWRTIEIGKMKHGLYILLQESSMSNKSSFVSRFSPCTFSSIVFEPFDLWHYRLGHVSHARESLLETSIHVSSCKMLVIIKSTI